ncbi:MULTISPECIES: hypothetical protein [unclassified Photobacterium]|uniref:hypothetical protein n=2 Tax=unclassified Photobacterium TaxID=2628852 RepID=UPI000D1548EC|nr:MULTISPECIES: hypothetical protein [unclassified Photobacterium]PSV31160.1 hypothetical protein C9J40_08925 [Photobacterium sp. GB-72]PSV34084.1 hypothetical protein C9J38_19085 [Photobacterium sp. GB-210]PSV41517.1 hypothetical protein C9J46_17650 [Photobacterium sp. GB-36]PSV53615.1 hypothetical protein C9J45_06060 [Photobacterium sp. GB-1]PSV57271.1 hypothetical protein C9J43_08845 [Photobacterium sp. GB-3]
MLKMFSSCAPLLFLLMLTYGCNVKSDVVYQSKDLGKVLYQHKDNNGCDLEAVDKKIAQFYLQIERRELLPLKAMYQESDAFIMKIKTLPALVIIKNDAKWYIPLIKGSDWIFVNVNDTVNVFKYPEVFRQLCE